MKKLSFIFAALLMSIGVIFAQTHVSNVVVSGVGQENNISQTGPGDITSNVTQSNANNIATVTQINPGLAVVSGIQSDVTQSGVSNNAKVTQDLTGVNGPEAMLKALINQSGNENEAVQKQGPHTQMGTTYAEILQGGNWNHAYQTQLKSNNDAVISQEGDYNTATQSQDVETIDGYEGTWNNATIIQSGNANIAVQDQHGWLNDASATQSGNGNHSSQLQSDNSWKNIAVVIQSGDDSEAIQEQVGNLNKAKIDQRSVGDYAKQSQISEGTRPVDDYTALNEAEIIQTGGEGNIAIQYQTIPLGEFVAATDANHAFIQQDGATNEASQTQTGGFNYSNVNQAGDANSTTVFQSQTLLP